MADIALPELAEGVDTATVSFWYFKVGDTVKEKDDLVELTTDKATFNMPSPCAGTIKEIKVEEGNKVKVGEILAVIQ
jgi:pyruvate dehydrogenase E2 component (dihydrolipoamide acetyltransferase)